MYVEEYQNNLTESFNEYSIVLILFTDPLWNVIDKVSFIVNTMTDILYYSME